MYPTLKCYTDSEKIMINWANINL